MTIHMILGAAIMYQLHLWAITGYLIFNVMGIYATMALACRHCYYHGKRCDLGLGLLSGFIFKKGRGNRVFIKNAPKTYPFLLVMIFSPIVAGAIILIWQFTLLTLFLTAGFITSFIILLASAKKLACSKCKMQGVCPFCMIPEKERIKL